MIASIVVLGLLACSALGAPNFNNGRIIGGHAAEAGEIPYIISLKMGGSHGCGGSILDARHVLTAAHCVYGNENNPSYFKIQYGSLDSTNGQNLVQVTHIKRHEDFYYGGNYPNDVAVLTLAQDIVFDENTQPTKLPTEDCIVSDSTDATLSGWGYTENGGVQKYLLTTTLTAWSDNNCKKYVGSDYEHQYHVCAGDLDGTHKQCSGDSGGPLYINGVQCGVVSWSYKPCTIQNRPGVFTRVYSYLDWIEDAMQN